jgi:hypothetical protein
MGNRFRPMVGGVEQQGFCQRRYTDMETLLIIVVVVLLLGGGGFYGRGRWY